MTSQKCESVTKEMLEHTFKSAEGRDDVSILDFKVSKGANFGDGFTTSIHRVEVDVKVGELTKTSTIVIKTLSEHPVMKSVGIDMGLFEKEIGFYHTILTSLINFQKERNVLTPILPSVPKFYHGFEDGVVAYLVLEDLKAVGFKMADVRKSLDINHCQLVMIELAKLHALSLAVRKGNPQRFNETIIPIMFDVLSNEEMVKKFCFDDQMKVVFNKAMAAFKSTSTNQELKEKMGTTIERYSIDPRGALSKLLNLPTEQFGVVCHGDAWCNNMMFRYEADDQEKRPLEVKLLDLQATRYALPTTDLSYFFYTSTTQVFRRQHLDDLLRLYHQTFMETLNHVNIDLPEFTFDCVKEMFAKTALFGVLMSFNVIPTVMADQSNLKKLEDSQTVEELMSSSNALSNDDKYGALMKTRLTEVVEDAIMMGL